MTTFLRRFKRKLDPKWHRKAVGGLWNEMGQLQFKFLLRQGLLPTHFLLDVGCGSLRGGIHFIRYLNPAHYFGIDKNNDLLTRGKKELRNVGLHEKHPTLVQIGDFQFAKLHQEFDFALAQSVFTHLPLNSIIKCVVNIDKVLTNGGMFFATFFENPQGKANLGPILLPTKDGKNGVPHFFDKDPYHYDFETFTWVCEGTGLDVEYIGDWGHPRQQKMMRFTKMKGKTL